MRVYRAAGLILFLMATAPTALAFLFDIHVDITKNALNDLMFLWAPIENSLVDAVKTGFSDRAVKEITEANVSKDTDDCGDKSNPDAIAIPCGGSPDGRQKAAISYVDKEPHYEHFDAETFEAASNALFDARENIIFYLQQRRFIAARKLLGGLLHGLQDFYAHSNYVELNYGNQLEERLGKQLHAFSQGYPQVAGPHEATCKTNLTPETRGFELLENFQHVNSGVPQKEDRLTSGIWVGTQESSIGGIVLNLGLHYQDPIEITQDQKCRHGINFAQYYGVIGVTFKGEQPGINKDSTLKPLFSKAGNLAKLHTLKFMMDLFDEPSVRQDPTIILGFMGHPTISSLSPLFSVGGPLANYSSTDLAFDITGEGFVKESAVFWNEEKLKTEFVNGTQLRAYVGTLDPAQQLDKVKVTVRNPGTDVTGKNMLFSSNPLPPLPVATGKNAPPLPVTEPDCPGAIRPHRHDPRFMDVNANRWNDTGLLVKQGQKVNIQVVPGMVVWRAGGLFSGATGEAPPQGDSTATPMTVLLWVDPPIDYRRVPIGALIGMIVGTDLLDADKKPTIPLIEKPDGVKYFPVLTGGQFVPPMPAEGRLYLSINDGAFFNNGGCFQVRVAPVK